MEALKINLVVASGVHQGKTIPVPGGKLIIGRDPTCNLRPASPAVSKVHCTIQVRDGVVFVTDHGSTNGTFVDDEQIDGEVQVELGVRIRVGPLDFTVQAAPGSKSDSTPLPDSLKAVDGKAHQGLRDATGPGAKPTVPSPQAKKETPEAMKKAPTEPSKPAPSPKPKPKVTSDDPENLAAMLLAEDDASNPPEVPEGSTIMEMPSVDVEKMKQGDKKPNAIPSAADSSNAADAILKKYLRRPR